MSFIGGPGAPPPPSQLGRLHAEVQERQLSEAVERYAEEHPAGTDRPGRFRRMLGRIAAKLRRPR